MHGDLPRPETAAEAIAARIASRRATWDEAPLSHQLDDVPGLLAHALRRRTVPAAVWREDLADVLEVLRLVRFWADRTEADATRLARDSGVTWADIARRQGLHSPQAAEQRYLRLTEALAHRPADVAAARKERCRQRLDPAGARRRQRGDAWLEANGARAVRVARSVAAVPLEDQAARDSADTLAEVLRETPVQARTVVLWLVVVLDELRSAGQLGSLPASVRDAALEIDQSWARLMRRPAEGRPATSRKRAAARPAGGGLPGLPPWVACRPAAPAFHVPESAAPAIVPAIPAMRSQAACQSRRLRLARRVRHYRPVPPI